MTLYSRRLVASIDVENCTAVKLVRGRSGTGLVLGDPRRVAERLHSLGATWIHVVDLDGARRGRPSGCVKSLVAWLTRELGIHVQLGGGLRSIEVLEEAYSVGAERLVVASAWLRRPGFLVEAAERLPGVVLAALEETLDALPAVHGWREKAPRPVAELASAAASVRGLAGVFYTQVFHEGEARGVDLLRSARLAKAVREESPGMELVYSGGVAGVPDLDALTAQGYDRIVTGMALHAWLLNPLGLLA